MLGDHETIAAIGTPRGLGALGIVRLSGNQTAAILSQCFDSKSLDPQISHKAYFGHWKNPKTSEAVDQVVVLYFAQGHGFTGEASADIICHGGIQVTEMVLEASLAAGARLARPGEFTYRAVLNNRLNLAQAESVLDLIHAKSPKAVNQALKNLKGALSDELSKIEQELVFLLANLEASIDFTTEDIQPVNFLVMRERAQNALDGLERLISSYVKNKALNHGMRVVFAGKPNAGKSSLMNSLLGKNRSIVAEVPGTTRDTIEAEAVFGGLLFRLIDTAGLHQTENEIERQGIARTLEELKSADLILYLIDSQIGIQNDAAEQIRELNSETCVLCFNKSDLKDIDVELEIKKFGLSSFKTIKTSAADLQKTENIRKLLIEKGANLSDSETGALVSTERQNELLTKAVECLTRSVNLLKEESSPEFVAFELKEAFLKIQETLGKDAGDDVMDRVFKEFCIGK